ncbi:MAG: hypothetical protein ACLUHA_16120 [Bacteroides stercoris]
MRQRICCLLCQCIETKRTMNVSIPSTQYANCYYKWNAIDPSYIITPENEHTG